MKKKLFSILTAVFIFVVCGVFSACGDKYKDMEFKIYYAFSQEASEWYDATDGISLNYGGADDEFQIDQNTGVGTLYLRVEIANVKAKHIDEIIVTKRGTSGGVNFSTATVDQNEVFGIDITGNTNSSLRFFETNSGKQIDIDLSIYRSLTGIQVDASIKPAVKVGDAISLTSLKNLYYLPMQNGNTLTNQTGVDYEIVGLGYYSDQIEDGHKKFIHTEDYLYAYNYMSISEDGVLYVYSDYMISNYEYIVRVSAVSKHNPSIYTEFDVYIVEDQEFSPKIYYTDYTDDSSQKDVGSSLTLYDGSEDYSSVNLTINNDELESEYKTAINTIDATAKYEICIYVDNKLVDLSSPEVINGLLVESVNEQNKIIRLTSTTDYYPTNKIKISYELREFDFSGSTVPDYSREIVINKSVLPENISINGELAELNDDLIGEMQGMIYSSNSSSYIGSKLTLLAEPTNANETTDIYIEANENVRITGQIKNQEGDIYTIESGATIFVRVASNVDEDQTITIRTQVSPSIFENQAISERFVVISYTLKKVVTADSIDIYADEDLNIPINNSSLNIDTKNETHAYIKVYYTGTTLETSSISLESDNSAIKFANNSTSILLNDPTVERWVAENDENGKYDLFRVSFLGANTLGQASISVVAGEGSVGVDTRFVANSVYLLQEETIAVESGSADAKEFTDIENGHFNFAVAKNRLIEFELLGIVEGASVFTDLGIVDSNITINTFYDANYSGNNFSIDAVSYNQLDKNKFSLRGETGAKTTVFSIEVTYYAKDITSGIITLANTTVYLDIAVYDPISIIDRTISQDQIVYINEKYDFASTSEITFSSYASNYSAASNSVVFSGAGNTEIIKTDASQLMIDINRDLDDDNAIEIVLVNEDGEEEAISDGTVLKNGSENILSGRLKVKLNGVSDYEDLTLSLTALRFGDESNTSTSVTIEFAQHEPVDGITLSGNSIVQNGIDSYYIYMSFMGVAENGDTSSNFSATPYYESNVATGLRYDDLTYNLYQIVQDENGNIVRDENGRALEDQVTSTRLNITIDSDTHNVTIRALRSLAGGLFRLELASMDSFDSATQSYMTTQSLFVSISDGTPQNKYVITNTKDLININNDLNANYVLRNNIIVDDITEENTEEKTIFPIGGESAFNGTLTGKVQNLNSDNEIVTSRYKITLNVNESVTSGDSVYAGLFARIGENGEISDLDIDVNFDTSSFGSTTTNGELNIGALAGANEGGTIKGVNVTLLGGSKDKINFVAGNISTPINFGGIVGLNTGYIDLTSSNVSADVEIEISTSAIVRHNIGMVAGKNSGEIFGGYLGKESLNSVNYSVIANLNITNSATNSSDVHSLYLGSIAGYNAGGYIHNLIVGGRISVSDDTSIANVDEIEGFVAGIAGGAESVTGSTVSVQGIETVAVLGLDLFAYNSSMAVAGIVGESISSPISDVRVLASKVSFDQGGLTSYGKIYGQGIVAGIVANSNGDEITLASVESFISNTLSASGNVEPFYMLKSDANTVAGLIYTSSSGTTLKNSFISANIDTNADLISAYQTIILTSNANETNVYFLGRVNNLEQIKDNIFARETSSGYYVVYTDNSILDFNADSVNELDLTAYYVAEEIGKDTLYTIQQFWNKELVITSENFNSQKEYLYIKNGETYEKVESGATFDDTLEYYLLDYTLWQNNRASLYVADKDGYLYSLTDFNFNPNITYYSINNVNIRDYYIKETEEAEEDAGNVHYIKNDNSNININFTYYQISWKTPDDGWRNTINGWLGEDTTNWETNSERNFITIYGLNFYFPYLVDDEENIVMIERPTQIQADINTDYIIEINSSYIDRDYPMQGYNLTSSTIINYHSDLNNPLNNESYNRYNIVNTASTGEQPNGLVDLNVIPSNAQGGVVFEIVRGSAYAYINSQNQIVFTGVSGANPIIVRCYSLFNDELEEFVAFFTQLGLSDLMLTSNSIYEVQEDDVDFELYTHTGANSTLVSISAENIYQGQAFATILDAGINNYLEVEAISNTSNSILNIVNANSTNGIMLEVIDDEFEGNMRTEMITFTLKLNLTEYFGEEFYPANAGVDQYLDLASTNLRVVIYKTATDIEIEGGDYSVYTNANIDFNVNLYTGYVSGAESGSVGYHNVNNTIMLDESDKDSINLTIDLISGQDELDKLMQNAGVTNIVQLFDFDFYYSLLKANEEVQGYQYTVEMNLKDEFNFRYITSSIEFRLSVYGANNTNILDSISIVFNPTELSTMRIENYTATSVNTITNYTSLIESNTTETSVLSPGGYGGVMMIYLEPSYSNIVSATLTSTSLYVPSLGRSVSIIFEQLVKNEDGKYETVYPNNEQVTGGIKLRLVSSVDDEGNYSYNGIIYIHTQMDKFVGMSGTVEANLSVQTGAGNTFEQTKTLITEYLPGATLYYDGISVNNSTNEYLIQKDTYSNEVNIRIYGYQFNNNPSISFVWKLNDGDLNYTYGKQAVTVASEEDFENRKLSLYFKDEISGNYTKCDENSEYDGTKTYYEDNRNVIIDKGGQSYNILDYLSYRFLNDYSEVEQNQDGSYTMTVLLNIYPDIPAGFEMKASLTLATDESLITSEQENSLIFYPVDYILTDINVANLNNGVMNIAYNRSSAINLSFGTNNPNADLSESIYEKLLTDISVDELASLFTYADTQGNIIKFSDAIELHPEFSVNIINEKLTITGINSLYRTIEFEVHYGYVLENGQYVLKFGTMSSNSLNRTMEFSFVLNIYASTTEENAIPIYSVDDIFDPETGACLLGEDADYILMNNIVLENLEPIDVDIASFDGNNKLIKIRSFAVGVDRTEYGLFANIGTYQDINGDTQTTILKNVIVDYSEFNSSLNLTNNEITDIAFGGLVANNGGLIYNCDVMNLSSTAKVINILLDNNSEVEIVFGGLVANNSGIITNSRVGRLGYTKITADQDSETSVQLGGGALTFVIGDSTHSTESGQGFVGVTAGFVGRNTGTIASSYVANTGITNYSTAPEGTSSNYSMTAGFVGENASTGVISYSYVKALENTISETNPRSTGVEIYSPTNGNVAGFVYLNAGRISNSFANTVLTSTSAYVAGFVYNNQSGAEISESYAACTLNGVFTANDASEQPFVGVSNSDELLSYGVMDNAYYLIDGDNSYIVKTESGKDQAIGLNQENFTNSGSLNGFVFIESNSRIERSQGVWSYYNQNNSYRILPELPNANQVSHSYRYLLRQENSMYIYSNAVSYEPGSANNPNIIRSVEEYNEIMLSGNTSNSLTGYVRFINNIDFASDETAIKTRVNFVLGDVNNETVTSVDGNGMTISGIYLDVGNAQEESIGLFAEIHNAYVKNLNLEFATTAETDGQFSSLSAIYSGGLAGLVDNGVIINITLDGASTTISGQNFAGGLAGIIKGASLIYGIDSNLSVKAVNTDVANYYNYYSEEEFATMRAFGAISYTGSYDSYLTQLSFAGGIAGVFDLDARQYADFNISYINVYGNEMYDKREIDANILADYAGGIAGYAGKETSSLRLKYYVGQNNLIRGQFAVGGIYAVSSGDITASQVTAEEDEQYTYDTTLGKYIIDIENGEETEIDTANAGNLNLLETYGYAGGLIGISINSHIDSCYSKAGFKVGSTIGGLIGVSIASNTVYSYAVPYINVDDTYLTKVGGLIGSAYGVRSGTIDRNQAVNEYINYLTLILGEKNKNTDIQFTFSTILVDVNDISTKNVETDKYVNFDYICADYGQLENGDAGYLTSNNGSAFIYVFAGLVDAYSRVVDEDGLSILKHTNEARSSDEELNLLYDTSEDNVEQVSTFNNIFSSWDTTYWTMDPERYFPLLLNEDPKNYILIETADDFYQMLARPDENFMIVEDIDMSEWCARNNTNFIFDIEFTGILVGQKEDNSIPVLYNLYLSPTNEEDAGLFRATNEATLRNITFEWGPNINEGAVSEVNSSVLLGTTVDTFGGVSAQDEGSLFSNLTVRVKSKEVDKTTSLFNSNNGTIAGFGGIVGRATNSNILNCTFSGRVDVTLTSNDGSINFGGLVAEANRESEDEENVNMTIMNSHIGLNDTNIAEDIEITEFNLTINDAINSYIGGAVGYASGAAVTSISVGDVSFNPEYRRIKFNINLANSSANNYFGGMVGGLENSQLSTTNAITEINVSGKEQTSVDIATRSYINAYAGLVGYYRLSGSNPNLNINSSNTSANINVANDTYITNLLISTGVAYAESSSEIEMLIEQSLFTGMINTELAEDSANNLKNVYAGGVFAYASSESSINVSEVMTTSNLIVGSVETIQLYAGSLIGQGNVVKATNFASTGRIVPITGYSEDPTNNHFYIGGFVGQANSVEITNAYSLTSIIADSIEYQALQALNINALFGDITDDNISTEYVYYSSDYALFTEESGAGYNLSAYTLTRTNMWRTDVDNGLNYRAGFWTEIESASGSYYLPYISSLDTQLVNYGILKEDNNTYSYQLNALTPTIVDNGASTNILVSDVEPEDFKYYILSNNLTQLSFTGGGVLNGILIGGESEYTEFGTQTSGEYTGIIPQVGRHSAISNLHIRLSAKEDGYKIGGATSGIIAGLNEGVIFNSSIQGTGITINSTNMGLVSGRNSGLISYSYSSLEIVEANATSLAGITYQNQGMILSCYFTGYINNANVAEDGNITQKFLAASIVVENVEMGGGGEYVSNFIYNTYSAGVIEAVSDQGNSFIAKEIGLMGANNYIDELANVENVTIKNEVGEEEYVILSTIDTAQLMSAEVLDGYDDGKWYYTTYKMNFQSYYLIDRDSETFGYNYLYPTLRVDKIIVDDSTEWDSPHNFAYFDNEYLLYTGTGAINMADGGSVVGYEEVLNALASSTDEDVVAGEGAAVDDGAGGDTGAADNALAELVKRDIMRIPHLGLLSAIRSLMINYGEVFPETEIDYEIIQLYYVLIYDIDGTYQEGEEGGLTQIYDWTPVGNANSSESNTFYIGSASAFEGFFVSNKNYDFTTLSLKDACAISNLSDGIFENIQDAYFGYLKLGGGEVNLQETGLLGVNVNAESEIGDATDDVTVDKIQILKNTIINASEYVGGLFGVISAGNISIKDLVTYNGEGVENARPNLTINSAEYAGLIAGKIEGGNIKLGFTPEGLKGLEEIGIEEENDSFYIRYGKNISYAGGLVGYIGNEKESSIDVSAYTQEEKEETGGEPEGEPDNSNNNKIVIFISEGGLQFLGGLVGASLEGNNSEIVIYNGTVKINQIKDDEGVPIGTIENVYSFGGLIATLDNISDNAAITFNNCGLDLGTEGLAISSDIANIDVGNFFGLLAAKVNGGTLNVQNFYFTEGSDASKITYELINAEEEDDHSNEGMGILVGILSGGNIIFDSSSLIMPDLYAVNLYNLGGIVGVYDAGSIGITNESAYQVSLYGTSNVGGAIGYVTGNSGDIKDIVMSSTDEGEAEGSVEAEVGKTEAVEYFDFIHSGTPFASLYINSEGYTDRSNWGGLFGYYDKADFNAEETDDDLGRATEVIEIINGNAIIISEGTTERAITITNVGGVVGKISGNTKAINKLQNSALIGPEEETEVWGLAESNAFIMNAVNPEDDDSKNTVTLNNVGGVIGYISGATDEIAITELNNSGVIQGNQNIGGVIGYISDSEGADEMTISAISNESNMIQGYQNVGGVIGYAGGATITGISNNTTEMVQGYQNVGGLIGYADAELIVSNELDFGETTPVAGELYFKKIEPDEATKEGARAEDTNKETYELYIAKDDETETLYNLTSSSANSGTVSGVLNVGGAFGIFNGELAENIFSEADVYGNANVGGFVGYVFNGDSTLSNNIVALKSEPGSNLIIKGVYLAINFESESEVGKSEIISEMFIPTSVGGFVGTMEDGILRSNSLFNSNVISSQEGDTSGITADDYNNKIISTVSNNMLKINVSTGMDLYQDPEKTFEYYTFKDDDYEIAENVSIVFNSTSSGFGGFAGTMSSYTALADEDDQYLIQSNGFQVNVNAQLGINVGTFYGYYYGGSSTGVEEKVILTPKFLGSDTVNTVAGGYNIGGVIGQYSGSQNLSQFTLSDTNSQGTISLQPIYTGMYVGGLFGVLQSNEVEGLVLDYTEDDHNINISINLANTYYAGGLVGKLYVTGNASFEGQLTQNVASGSTLIAEKFGALIGLLKVDGSTGGSGYNVTVKGDHGYPFTINTIENSNYEDGESKSGVSLSGESSVDLVAMATYINKDTFNISPSNSSYDNNPTRADSWGWAKEYTMFKTMQRCIPASDNKGAPWDAISVVYDASNITNVGTISNLNLTNTYLYGEEISSSEWKNMMDEAKEKGLWDGKKIVEPRQSDEDYAEKLSFYNSCKVVGKSGDKYLFNPNYICYTIYEEADGIERMYSAIGIAEPYFDENGDYSTPLPANTSTDEFKDYVQWVGAILGFSEPPNEYYSLVLNEGDGYEGYTYIDYSYYGENNSNNPKYPYYDVGGGGTQDFWPSSNSYRDYFCTVDNFWAYDEDGESREERTDTTYFMFTYFYTNDTLNNSEVSGVRNTLADSGSMFDVNGLHSDAFETFMQGERDTYPWLKYAQWATVAVTVMVGFFTAGGGSLLLSAGKALLKKIGQTIAKMTVKKFLKGALVVGIGAVIANTFANMIISQSVASQSAETVYYNIKNENLGYIGELYRREIAYDDEGKVKISTDSTADNAEGIKYVFYSQDRPDDYYTNRYFVYIPAGEDNYETIYMESIDIENAELVTSGNFEGAYEFKYLEGTAYAYEYYIYQNNGYYILMDAMQTSTVPTQMPLPDALRENYDYIYSFGNIYVRGKYEGTDYVYDQNSGEIDNAIVYDEDKDKYTINRVEWDTKWGSIKATKGLKYSILNDDSVKENKDDTTGMYYIPDGGMGDGRYYYGYGYMKNAYYTAIGSGRIENAVEKIGTFKIYENPGVPAGERGIDYVTRTYIEYGIDDDGYPIVEKQITYYYTISKIEDRDKDDATIENKFENASGADETITDLSELPDEVYVKLYPHSFNNLYTSDIDNSQDSYIYQLNADKEAPGVGHSPTYYYYEGGYITEEYGEKGELVAYQKVYDSSNTSSGTEPVIKLYTANGEIQSNWYSYEDIYNNYDTVEDFVEDFYVQDITGLEEGTDTNIYKVSNQYKTENGCLYQMIADKQIDENGKLSTIMVSFPNATDESFNKNKYLMQAEIQLFTRYKYNDIEDEVNTSLFFGGLWEYTDDENNKEYYYFYKEDSNTPNPGMTTYLVESCRVILGGASISGASGGGINLA